jgi:hypothetical protein
LPNEVEGEKRLFRNSFHRRTCQTALTKSKPCANEGPLRCHTVTLSIRHLATRCYGDDASEDTEEKLLMTVNGKAVTLYTHLNNDILDILILEIS